MVYVTHDQIEAMTMADRIVVLNGGNIEQAGAPMDLYEKPVNLFVAGFIGSPEINMLKATYLWQRLALKDGGSCRSPRSKSQSEAPLVYGVRPQHITLAGNRRSGNRHRGRTNRRCAGSAGPYWRRGYFHRGTRPCAAIAR